MNIERCQICEGIDAPGLFHNPEAPYCSERDEGCDTNPITDWKFSVEPVVDPHALCCARCRKNLIILDEIANLAHGYKALNGTLGAVGDTLLSILDKER